MTSQMQSPSPPPDADTIPPPVRRWLDAELGDSRRLLGERPLVAVAAASAMRAARNDSTPIPPAVLRGWSLLLHSARRKTAQAERLFIQQARTSGWSNNEIAEALLLDDDADVASYLESLNELLHRRERPRYP